MTESHFIAPEHQKMFDDLMSSVIDQVQEHGSDSVANSLEELSTVLKEKLVAITITPDGQASEAALLKMTDVLDAQAKHLRNNPTPSNDSESLPNIG
ncbi:MAG: hypothetical protein QM703_21135 [Gemmatales bacterium]